MPDASIYLFDDLTRLPAAFMADSLTVVPPFRREQCLRYHRESDRIACILAYQLLCRGLDEQYGIAPPSFIYNPSGKPYLPDTPGVFFSLSHCPTAVVCAIGDAELGVDVQDVRPYDADIASRVCTGNELAHLSESPDPSSLLCRLWTQKESYAKAMGIGVAEVLAIELPEERFIGWGRAAYQISLCFRAGDAASHNARLVTLSVSQLVR